MILLFSLAFFLSPISELLAELKFNYTTNGDLDSIYKIFIRAKNPSHFLSFWLRNDTSNTSFRIVSFNFQLQNPLQGATIAVYTPSNRQSRTGWGISSTLKFDAPPLNYASNMEFLYYFTVYRGGVYFTMPTTSGIKTIIRSADQWFDLVPPNMQLVCGGCDGKKSEEIFFSKLNWGKKDVDLWALEGKARELYPNYMQNPADIDEKTKEKLEAYNEKDEL